MSVRTWYRHRDRVKRYYSIIHHNNFVLVREDGSLSSCIAFNSEQEAINEGWYRT